MATLEKMGCGAIVLGEYSAEQSRRVHRLPHSPAATVCFRGHCLHGIGEAKASKNVCNKRGAACERQSGWCGVM